MPTAYRNISETVLFYIICGYFLSCDLCLFNIRNNRCYLCSVKKMFDILESDLLDLCYIHFIVMKSVWLI